MPSIGETISVAELQGIVCDFHTSRTSMDAYNKEPLVTESSLVIEAAEVLEVAKYEDFNPADMQRKYAEELADVMIFLFILANNRDVDLASEVIKKVAKNEARFPEESFQGTAQEYPHQYMTMKVKNGERKVNSGD